MKRIVGLPILILLLAALASCEKNEFTLAFAVPSDVNIGCRIVYYASAKNGGVIRETVAQIAGGKGETTLPQRYPSLVFLFAGSSRMPAAIIYARHGEKFEIKGKDTDMALWEITGNKTTEALSAWRIKNRQLIGGADDKLNKAVEAYVKDNPDSPAAAILLYCYFARRGHEKQFYRLQKILGSDVTGDEYLMSALSAADLITGLPDTPAIPRRLILTGDSGYADTVAFAKGKGALLMFRANDDSGMSMDTVKALLSKVKRQDAAEIFVDTDSLSWRRHVRKDTVEGLRRLWLPLGLADSVAMNMGVRRIPFYIVLNPKGKELYRGTRWEDAAKKFESLKDK